MSTDLLIAIYGFAAHFHSGQGSRGYRLSCRAQRLLARRNPNVDYLAMIEYLVKKDSPLPAPARRNAVNIYWNLVDAHGDSI